MGDIYKQAERLDHVLFSPVRKVLERANQLAAEGKSILHLEIGEPDFDTPKDIVDATVKALVEEKKTHYPPNRGVLRLRQSIAAQLKQEYGLEYDAASEILMTCGAAEAIFDAIEAVVNEGDEVIIMTPAYMNYENCINMVGAKCVKVELLEQSGYQVDAAALEAAVTEKTKMIVVTNPSNPSGTVLNRDSLEKVAAIAKKHDIVILADEIYAAMHYGVEFLSFASLEGMKERTIVVSGFSKCYAMTGWRVGYVACDARFIPQILKVHQYATTCIPNFIQEGLATGMLTENTKREADAMVAEFDRRRKLVLAKLDKIPNVEYSAANGAFYVFANVGKTGLDGTEFATRLLEEKGVALVPGAAFGESCKDCIRISYGTKAEIIEQALDRMAEFVASL